MVLQLGNEYSLGKKQNKTKKTLIALERLLAEIMDTIGISGEVSERRAVK